MKNALQVLSWLALVAGVLAIISGLTELSTAPDSAYYSLIGGAMFAAEGLVALIYINQKEETS